MRPFAAAFLFAPNLMPDLVPDIPHPKRRGEWAELRFMSRAAEFGLAVAKPWGDSSPYDFAVEHRGHFLRVQVKCTRYRRGRSYKCHITAGGAPYSRDSVDFIAAYIIPLDLWYILPVAAIRARDHVLLSPHRPNSRYEQFKEARHLLRASTETCPWRDECRDRSSR